MGENYKIYWGAIITALIGIYLFFWLAEHGVNLYIASAAMIGVLYVAGKILLKAVRGY